MKKLIVRQIVILTVNSREMFGDKAKTDIVGVYRIDDEEKFMKAVDTAGKQIRSKTNWVHPEKRAEKLCKTLRKLGYKAITTKTIFVPMTGA